MDIQYVYIISMFGTDCLKNIECMSAYLWIWFLEHSLRTWFGMRIPEHMLMSSDSRACAQESDSFLRIPESWMHTHGYVCSSKLLLWSADSWAYAHASGFLSIRSGIRNPVKLCKSCMYAQETGSLSWCSGSGSLMPRNNKKQSWASNFNI